MSELEPPPRIIEKFNQIWKDWLFFLYEYINKHTGGGSPTPPTTGSNWNAHGDIALSDGTAARPLKIEDGSFWIDCGTSSNGNVDATGEYPAGAEYQGSDFESKILWIGDKGAFRAGKVSDTRWDDSTVGYTSFACGNDAAAYGNGTVAIGTKAIAGTPSSITSVTDVVAIGQSCVASSTGTVAIGSNAEATNLFSVGLGVNVTANCLFGGGTIGYNLSAGANNAWVIGAGLSSGNRFTNNTAQSMMLGVGLGSSDTATVTLRNKRVGINNENPLSTMDVAGSFAAEYTNVTCSNNGTTNLADEYILIFDVATLSSSATPHTVNFPALGASTIDRRVYYLKVVSSTGTYGSGVLRLQPSVNDGLEDITGGGVPGTLLPDNQFINISFGGSGRGIALTFIADVTSGGWWVI